MDSDDDDQEKKEVGNLEKTTDAIESFDKVITYAEDNITKYTAIQVMRTLDN